MLDRWGFGGLGIGSLSRHAFLNEHFHSPQLLPGPDTCKRRTPPKIHTMRRSVKTQLLAIAGIIVACYALSVESHMDDEDYEASASLVSIRVCTPQEEARG